MSKFNFFEYLEQLKITIKFISKYYPMVKSILSNLDEYIDNPLLDKIIYYINRAESMGLSGEEKKKFVMDNAKIPEDKSDVIDRIISVVNQFK